MASDQASDSVFGTCQTLLDATNDNAPIVNPFPAQPIPGEISVNLNDDIVVSHGSALNGSPETNQSPYVEQKVIPAQPPPPMDVGAAQPQKRKGFAWFPFLAFIFFVYAIKRVFFNNSGLRRDYEPVQGIGLTV